MALVDSMTTRATITIVGGMDENFINRPLTPNVMAYAHLTNGVGHANHHNNAADADSKEEEKEVEWTAAVFFVSGPTL